MKTIHFLIPLLGAALAAVAAEPARTNSSTTTTEMSAAKNSTTAPVPAGAVTMADEQKLRKVGERIALSGAVTKAPPSRARTLGELVNPFAPLKPEPEIRWIERAAWSTVAESGAASSTPAEMRHESHFGVSIASR